MSLVINDSTRFLCCVLVLKWIYNDYSNTHAVKPEQGHVLLFCCVGTDCTGWWMALEMNLRDGWFLLEVPGGHKILQVKSGALRVWTSIPSISSLKWTPKRALGSIKKECQQKWVSLNWLLPIWPMPCCRGNDGLGSFGRIEFLCSLAVNTRRYQAVALKTPPAPQLGLEWNWSVAVLILGLVYWLGQCFPVWVPKKTSSIGC